MSWTSISKQTRWKVWLKSGGRCEYRGCNKPLWRDDETMKQMNRAYLAHIIADSPDGPRGKEELSDELSDDFENIMLLCDTHHRLIDREEVEEHPPELLREYKREHEERIERLTGIESDHGTHILLFGTKIGTHRGAVNHDQARQAVLPGRYPNTERGIRLDLNDTGIDESSSAYWPAVKEAVDSQVGRLVDRKEGPKGKTIEHLSVFGLAPIPALAYLGRRIGDTIPADVYQRHRETGDWQWAEEREDPCSYIVDQPSDDGIGKKGANGSSTRTEEGSESVAVRLSLSGDVQRAGVEKALGYRPPLYTITIDEPGRDFLDSEKELERFRKEWMSLLAEIRGAHGANVEIHLFPAVPNSVAIEIGRTQLPKSDPPISVYDHNREKGGFIHALTLT